MLLHWAAKQLQLPGELPSCGFRVGEVLVGEWNKVETLDVKLHGYN